MKRFFVLLYAITGFAFVIKSFVTTNYFSFDYPKYDVYVDTSGSIYDLTLAGLFVLFSILAEIAIRFQLPFRKRIFLIHSFLTITTCVLSYYLFFYNPPEPKRYYNYSVYDEFTKPSFSESEGPLIAITASFFVLAQLIVVYELVRSILQHRKTQ